MQFDSEDLAILESQGTLQAVVLHEMMHVLGLGSIWQEASIALLVGASTADPFFVGAGARGAFVNFNGGAAYSGTPVPVENTGGAGTVNSHWRESVLRSELMTGWVTIGGATPMSRTTVASMGDLGYSVDVTKADPFDLAAALRLMPEQDGVRIVDDVMQAPLHEVDEVSGEVRPVRQ